MTEPILCPFCGFKGESEYKIQLHIEEHHTEDSPFVASHGCTFLERESDSALPPRPLVPKHEREPESENHQMPGDSWTKCTRPGCGEYVLLVDIDEHLEMHAAIAAVDESKGSSSDSLRSQPTMTPTHQSHPKSRKQREKLRKPSPQTNGTLMSYFSGRSTTVSQSRQSTIWEQRSTNPGRLGKRELGPWAWERAMPLKVRHTLEYAGTPRQINRIGRDGRLVRDLFVENETANLIPVLADLCDLDQDVDVAYFCHPSVRHVYKLECEGNFCGYWNIQMLLTYLFRGTGALVPNVLQIQDTIETAWNAGVCSYGRVETGGIRNTRKWIGTHEAAAYFLQTGVPVDALSFQKETDVDKPAYEALLDHVEAYFVSALDTARKHGISRITQLAPMYFQREGHSMTIVGLERMFDGSRNLLVFDSSFPTSMGVRRLLDGKKTSSYPDELLRVYRKSEEMLSRWKEFEIVM